MGIILLFDMKKAGIELNYELKMRRQA